MNVDIMNDASEIVHYDTPGIPIYVRHGLLSNYPNFRALCHWHEDIEFIHVLQGHMDYYINGKHVRIEENDGILITPAQMHYGYSIDKTECDFFCILIHPSVICDNPKLNRNYIAPIIGNSQIEFYYLHSNHPSESKVLAYLDQIYALKQNHAPGYELEVIGFFHLIWAEFFRFIPQESLYFHNTENPDITAQRKMVSFIYQNYASKLALGEIASSGGVCRSKCCQIFKKYLNHTPIEFLNTYRLEVSQYLLLQTDTPITDIAFSCGFNHLSYYSEMFRSYYGCTPKEYRMNSSLSFSK